MSGGIDLHAAQKQFALWAEHDGHPLHEAGVAGLALVDAVEAAQRLIAASGWNVCEKGSDCKDPTCLLYQALALFTAGEAGE